MPIGLNLRGRRAAGGDPPRAGPAGRRHGLGPSGLRARRRDDRRGLPRRTDLAVAVQRDDPYFELPSWKRGKETARRMPTPQSPEGATIVLLDGETGGEKGRIAAPGTTLWGLAFSPDGKTLAATCGRGHGQIRLYRVSTGGLIRSISTPAITGPCLAFSPDGSRLATAMADTSVLLWDLRLGP